MLDAQLKFNSWMFEPGVYELSIEDYHASAGISRSAISELKKSPLHYWDKYINSSRKKEKPSPAMVIGSAVHTLLLEPYFFDYYFIKEQKFDCRNSGQKKLKEQYEKRCEGKELIKIGWQKKIADMVMAVNDHSKASRIINDASIEKSYYWIDKDTNLLCKSRPDIYNEKLDILADLKTTKEASPDVFKRNLIASDYHIQAAMQREAIFQTTGKLVTDFVFIAVPSVRPYKPYIYRLDEEVLQQGLFEFKQALALLSMCYYSNKWDIERDEIITLTLPPWANNHNPFQKLMEIYPCQI